MTSGRESARVKRGATFSNTLYTVRRYDNGPAVYASVCRLASNARSLALGTARSALCPLSSLAN